MVYVLDKNGHPLMPTNRHGKVRRMLKSGNAKVIRRCPFTIQLLYDSTDYTQPVNLGIDAGSRHIGVSATTETKVLYEADVTLRNDIVDLLSTRREARRTRRSRKTRYRKPRFNNRTRKDGWLAPSVRQKVDTHLTTVRKVTEILPVSSITVETASFDIQKIKNQIYSLKRENEREFEDIGKKVYEHFKTGEIGNMDFISQCEAIEKREEQVEELENKICQIKGE